MSSTAVAAVIDRLAGPIEPSRVMQANGWSRTGFPARCIGRFVRQGANPWNAYRLELIEPAPFDVWPAVRLHIEPEGTVFRLRRKGVVVLAAWAPAADAVGDPADFVANHIDAFGAAKGTGVAAFIARTLSTGR